MKNTHLVLIGIAIAAVLGLLLLYISTADRPKDGGSEHANSENSDGEFPDIEVGESVEQGGYTIERLPDAETEHIAAPSLNRKLVRPNNMEVAVFAQIESNIAETIAVLKIEDNFTLSLKITKEAKKCLSIFLKNTHPHGKYSQISVVCTARSWVI